MRQSHCKTGTVLLFIALLLLPLAVHTQQPAQPNRAGQVTALIPVDYIVRQQAQLDAAKDMPLLWRDLVTTERGGRVRAQLDDGSVLNVGSESSLFILEHDAQIQRSELELLFGEIRARVVRIVRPGGKFELRTPGAVVGVVGTDLYVTGSATATTVIALGGGRVTAQSTDPQFPEVFLLEPGEMVEFVKGQRPGPKRLATVAELVRALESTLVDTVDRLASAAAIRGRGLVTLDDGTAIEAVLTRTLDARSLKPGDVVEAKSVRDVKADGEVVLEKNARLIGRVTTAQARARGAGQSALGVVFEKAVLRDGREVPLQMSLQAIASAQAALAASEDLWATPSQPSGGAGASGGLLGGTTSTVQRTTRTVTDNTRDIAGATDATARAGATVGGRTAVALTPSSTGALGLPGVSLETGTQAAAEGSLITSRSSTVRLASGTRLLLRTGSSAN